jgi:hypothetical protein
VSHKTSAPILIVRTVSVEKLSPVLDACAARWPGHPLLVVSSPGRGSELRTDPRVTEIIPYATGAEGFVVPILCEHALEAVVVPVANRGGSGYANVMRACRALDTRTWWIASYARDLLELSPAAWSRRWWRELALAVPARWIGRAWGCWILRPIRGRPKARR